VSGRNAPARRDSPGRINHDLNVVFQEKRKRKAIAAGHERVEILREPFRSGSLNVAFVRRLSVH
jgi:hypothetical protein